MLDIPVRESREKPVRHFRSRGIGQRSFRWALAALRVGVLVDSSVVFTRSVRVASEVSPDMSLLRECLLSSAVLRGCHVRFSVSW